MRFSSSLLFSILVLGGTAEASNFVPATSFDADDAGNPSSLCPLKCHNGGTCARKTKAIRRGLQLVGKQEESEWECECPEGYGGSFCEFQRRRAQSVTCGTLTCLNGGKCGDNQNYTTSKPLCDCSAAFEIGDNNAITKYVGQVCEIEIDPSEYCPQRNADLFCVNGGTCRVDMPDFMDKPCQCRDGYTGRHCEYLTEDVVSECVLTCSGRGTCQHGFNTYGDQGANLLVPGMDQSMTQKFMHCNCDPGYVGPNCEYDYVKCGGQRKYCFHGASCLEEASGDAVCDCTGTNVSGVMATGQFCEYKATDRCEEPNELSTLDSRFDVKNQINASNGLLPFCVNDGLCYKLMNTELYYCDCTNTGYTGFRCEIDARPTMSPQPTPALTDSMRPTIDYAKARNTKAPTRMPKKVPTSGKQPTWPPTEKPVALWMPTMATSQSEDNPDLSPGAKFGVIFGTFFTIFALFSIVIYFDRRKHFVDDIIYQGNNGEQNTVLPELSEPYHDKTPTTETEMTNQTSDPGLPSSPAPTEII